MTKKDEGVPSCAENYEIRKKSTDIHLRAPQSSDNIRDEDDPDVNPILLTADVTMARTDDTEPIRTHEIPEIWS
jgi:hypothetical protein